MERVPSSPGTSSADKLGGRTVALLLLGLVVLFGALYALAYAVAGDNVPRGTEVSGVSLGGEPQAQAAERLEEGLAERVARDVEISVDGTTLTATPEELGLSVDHEASVAEAGGVRSWSPVRLWTYFTGGEHMDAVVDVDEEKFDAFLDRIDEEHGKKPVDGTVTFHGGAVETSSAVVGEAVDPEDARDALVDAYLAPEATTAELELVTTSPEIDDADVEEARTSFAEPAVSAPVTLTFDKSDLEVRPETFTRALSLEPVDGRLEPTLDAKKLHAAVESVTGEDGKPVDATVKLVNGSPQVVPGKPGVTYDHAQLEESFLDLVVAEGDDRSLGLSAEVAQPDFTTEDAEKLGIKEKVSSFSTEFPYAEYRNVNIGRAAELVNGTLLKPGETFSLNETVGERTRENGFTEGFMIADGIFKSDLGGGVSQMATTVFNAMFFAGLEDVEHKPHSFYISRYPVGREATVAWGAVDLRFKNDTDYGVLVQASVKPSTPSSPGVATVSMWSTKVWDIESETGPKYAFTSPETRTMSGPDCVPNTGYGGFDIDVKRIFREHGSSKVVRTENFHTTYTPSDTVVCKEPKPRKGD